MIILPISIFFVFIGAALGYHYFLNESEYRKVYYGDISMKFKVGGCSEVTKADEININVVGSSVTFNQILNTYCRPSIGNPKNFIIELSLTGNNLTVKEIHLAENAVSRCLCPATVKGKISNIPKGTYDLVFRYESILGNETGFPRILGTFEIFIQ